MNDVLFKTEHFTASYLFDPRTFNLPSMDVANYEYVIRASDSHDVATVSVIKYSTDPEDKTKLTAWSDEVGGSVVLMSSGTALTDYVCTDELYREFVRCVDEIYEIAAKETVEQSK